MRDTAALDSLVLRVAEEHDVSGVVRVDHGERMLVERAFGSADRRHGIANTPATLFGAASATKGLTALAVMRLVELGTIDLSTTARSLLGDDLPLIDDAVTVEHLLAHRSGIGDYLDEESDGSIDDYVMPVPVHELDRAEAYLAVLGGFEQRERPGDSFRYNNGGYVVLALLAERAADRSYHELVDELVLGPAQMTDTAFLRSDELPGSAAIGYLGVGDDRTNVLHLPVVGVGDGGISTTAADVRRLWVALRDDTIVSPATRSLMLHPRSDAPVQGLRYGLGFWLHATRSSIALEGMDAGISFRSVWDPERDVTHTTIGNTSSSAWQMTAALDEALGLA